MTHAAITKTLFGVLHLRMWEGHHQEGSEPSARFQTRSSGYGQYPDARGSRERCAAIPWYFVGTVLQFQLHRALCQAAGQYEPGNPNKALHKCDIYRSKEAGNLLKRMMELGSSVPWQEALYLVTGERRMNGSAIREYFAPLEEWLRQENLRTQEFVGWVYDGDYCRTSLETAGLQVTGGYYNAAPGLQIRYDNMIVGAVIVMLLCFL
ncbi:angiotensin-converting enzyme [Anabrus simplex]|uniref:angiotensin-converting enzyme n=1 Tax=Anabrus simplex TaxID=316456 RepID=UPI0035A3811B